MAELTVSLPKKANKVVALDPRLVIIYGPPKVGKTTLLSTLPNNLILDLEEGADYVEALSMTIIGWNAPANEPAEEKKARYAEGRYYLTEAGKAVMDAGRPYDFITVDTATKLEEIVMPVAVAKYKKSPMGGGYDGHDVRELPRGAGYYWLREAFEEALGKIQKLAKTVILIGHVKDAFINKEGKEVSAKEVDLTGKIKFITCAAADAIGYVYRGANNELMLNFKSNDTLLCGARCPHLRGKDIKIADYDEEANVITNVRWDLIFPDKIKA